MSACDRFKQNAWKKELCSNCYKPKEEHQQKTQVVRVVCLPNKSPSQGILNIGAKKQPKKKKKSVRFNKDESEVIGYGGVDSDDDDDDDDDFEFEKSEQPSAPYEKEIVGDEEKALERLTKTNTDFNSVLGNLNGCPEPPVQLGKPQKQTVQVTIQPFTSSSIAASRKSHLNKLLEDEEPKPSILSFSIEEKNNEPAPKKLEVKTIVIQESIKENGKKEERGTPEGRKTQITRGNVITKNHELVKNKLKAEKRVTVEKLKKADDDEEEDDIKRIVIVGPNIEEKNAINFICDSPKPRDNCESEKNEKVKPVSLPPIESILSPQDQKKQEISTKANEKCIEEVTVKVLKLLNGETGPPESREMAGEPDGKADSDEPETPTVSPQPRVSFLHREIITSPQGSVSESNTKQPLSVAPALPTTPPPVLNGQSSPIDLHLPLQIITTPTSHLHLYHHPKQPSQLQTSPLASPADDSSPVLPEVLSIGGGSVRKRPAPKPPSPPPEPVPRRRNSGAEVQAPATPPPLPPPLSIEKKKTRVRQTLKKLLRFGSKEDENNYSRRDDDSSFESHLSTSPQGSSVSVTPKPRLQIIHPLDLNKSGVQVLPPSEKTSPEPTVLSTSAARPSKPPPPPRSESLNLMERLRPSPGSPVSGDNLYANLGESRCGIAPVKPQRTGSLRDISSSINKTITIQNDSDNVYEIVGVSSNQNSSPSERNSDFSESESDIYYPYVTFQNGEMKTILKKRGIVHSSLEDNYSAVVVANLEALTDLLQRETNKALQMPQDFYLNVDAALTFEDFQLDSNWFKIHSYYFVEATINQQLVTVVFSENGDELKISETIKIWTRFTDIIPFEFRVNKEESILCHVSITGRCHVRQFLDFVKSLKKSSDGIRFGIIVLLELLEWLEGFDGLLRLGNLIVCSPREEQSVDALPIVGYLFVESNEQPIEKEEAIRTLIESVLDSSLLLNRVILSSVSNVPLMISLLRVWMWGPGASAFDPSALRRWLDLERANALHSFVKGPLDLPKLKFLVTTDPEKVLKASKILHSANTLLN